MGESIVFSTFVISVDAVLLVISVLYVGVGIFSTIFISPLLPLILVGRAALSIK